MPLFLQAGLLGLLCGPIAYYRINRPIRAAVSAGILAVLLVGFAYLRYLALFIGMDSGDAVATAIAATKVWLGLAPSWGMGLIGVYVMVNVPCAIDAARLAAKTGSKPEAVA
ncbi:hypothetical protein D3C72_1144530 [compost metagenome]